MYDIYNVNNTDDIKYYLIQSIFIKSRMKEVKKTTSSVSVFLSTRNILIKRRVERDI